MIDFSIWKKAWALLDARERRNAWIVLAIVVLAALSSAVMVGSVMPFLSVLADPGRIQTTSVLRWLYETGGFETEYGFLVFLGAISLVAIIVGSLMQILRTWAVARFSLMRLHTLSSRLLGVYLHQPFEYFIDHHTGEMSTQILSECEQVVGRFFAPAADVTAALFSVTALIVVLFWVNPVVTLVAFAVLGGIYGGTFFFSRRLISRKGRERADANRKRFRFANEALSGIKDIKLLGREQSYLHRFQSPSLQMVRAQMHVQLISSFPQFVMQAVGFGGIIVLCLLMLSPQGLASGSALGGIWPLLGVFAFAGQRLLPELAKIYQGVTQLNYGAAAVDAIHRDLTTKTSKGIGTIGSPAPLGLSQRLELEHVLYSYPKSDRANLQDISLSIRAGEKIGVVGSTGAGKTTLVDVILGLLRPSSGRLVVDGKELTDDDIRAWQQTVGYVPQDIFLTDASVAENIALGLRPEEIEIERLHRAARIAQIDHFVTHELPLGYDTLVGERGVRLSGGQRQRIGIARALYHDADLIVFDEATSALDNLTEAEVMSAIEALPGDKTVIMIAHRLSTVRQCDSIVVLESGKLVGMGPWEELAANNAAFQKIARVGNAA